MKAVIVGMGIQGQKRKKTLGSNFVYSVDKFVPADFKFIKEVPEKDYDTVFVCVPDDEKYKIVEFCLKKRKHILIEKPFIISKKKTELIKKLQKKNKLVCYTAYNHRFEPHFLRMKKLIKSKVLGKIYSCRLFYGNGTASLVKKSKWKDKNLGIITDLGSHLIDTSLYWFGRKVKNFKLISRRKYENKSLDHAIMISENSEPKIQLEMSYYMWSNYFTCDILAEKGSAHITSLCKWGPSTFIYRKRSYPAGKPKETLLTLKKKDPTWVHELKHFKKLISKKKLDNFDKDQIIREKILKSLK